MMVSSFVRSVFFTVAGVAWIATSVACRCGVQSEGPGAPAAHYEPTPATPTADVVVRATGPAYGSRRLVPGISPRVMQAIENQMDAGPGAP